MWFKMFSKWSWSVQAVCVILSVCSFGVSDALVTSCGYIEPESPVVPIGSTFTAYCILGARCRDYGDINANQIIWKTKTEIVPKEQYWVINQTVSSVTFNDTSKLVSPLTCNILVAGNIEQNIYGINIQLGLPPDKPENLTCIVYQVPTRTALRKYIPTCTWEPGRYTWRNTTYILKKQWPNRQLSDCKPQGSNSSCNLPDVVFYVDLEVWVIAKNDLGEVESDHIIFDPAHYVKPLPPKNLSVTSSEFSTALKLSWQNQFTEMTMNLKFNIQYKSENEDWIEVPLEDTKSQRTSFLVQGLKPHTKYVFHVRCTITNCSNCSWSDWSDEKSGITAEAKPSKGPDIWRKISATHSPGNWTLLLMWKELNNSEANGIIRKYNVSIMGKPPVSFPPEFYSMNTTKLTLNVPNRTYEVRVTAYNNAGGSPTSVLLIPAVNTKASVKDVKAFPKDHKLWVEWSPPRDNVNKYIIEWCEDCNSSQNYNNLSHWQQEPGSAQGTFLRGDLKPFKCYTITVYPLYTNGQGEEKATQAYLQQDVPAVGPSIQTKKVGKSEVLLEWKPLSVEEQNGFIRYYVINYKIMSENETGIRVEPSKTEYALSSLKSDTLYMVQLAAYTDEGGKRGPTFTFTTQKFAEGEIEAIVVPICLAFLIMTLLGVLFCFNKRDIIKKHIWPNVPDPSKSVIAQWSPETPSKRFNSKDQIYPEGSFTDVSVVEIEGDDNKYFSEQDPKPFDLLKKENNASEGHSSGIGGSSCMSSPQQSVSDSDEGEPAQNTSSTVQYSTVVPSGYRDQIPSVQVFSRSESTQPLLDSEERSEDQPVLGSDNSTPRYHYFKQNCNQDETTTDDSHLERVKQISPINEEDLAGLQAPQKCDSSPGREEQGDALASAFHPSPEGPIPQVEATRINTVTDELPKCYLPQTVRQGGYMPQ